MEQIGIALTGVVAIWLSQDVRDSVRKYACLFGMAGQPFWFYSAYTAEQWGIFALCTLYTWAWWKGIRLHWIKKPVSAEHSLPLIEVEEIEWPDEDSPRNQAVWQNGNTGEHYDLQVKCNNCGEAMGDKHTCWSGACQ